MNAFAPKPVPRREGLNGEFYAHIAKGELRFQRCKDCRTWRHMPRHTCAHCGSSRWKWEQSAGLGRLYSWTVTHRSFHPAFDGDVPYAVAVVEMDEGVRLVSRIEGASTDAYRLGMRLQVQFTAQNAVAIPIFAPV